MCLGVYALKEGGRENPRVRESALVKGRARAKERRRESESKGEKEKAKDRGCKQKREKERVKVINRLRTGQRKRVREKRKRVGERVGKSKRERDGARKKDRKGENRKGERKRERERQSTHYRPLSKIALKVVIMLRGQSYLRCSLGWGHIYVCHK